jgi:hypothetical protein
VLTCNASSACLLASYEKVSADDEGPGSGGSAPDPSGATGGMGPNPQGGEGATTTGGSGACTPTSPTDVSLSFFQGTPPYESEAGAGGASSGSTEDIPVGDYTTERGYDVTVDEAGGLSYDAAGSFWGVDRFSYSVDDGCDGMADGSVTLSVHPAAGTLDDIGDNESGFEITGLDSVSSVAGADLDADGLSDLLIGQAAADSDSGRVYVLRGAASLALDIDVAELSFSLAGSAAEAAGTSISSIGDVNCDDRDDFVVGAPGSNPAGGGAYVVFGVEANDDVDLAAAASDQVVRMDGLGLAGTAVSGGGDIDGDGHGDFVVSGPQYPTSNRGRVWAVFSAFEGCGCEDDSSCFSSPVDLEALGDHGFAITSGTNLNLLGRDAAILGNVTGDSKADIGTSSNLRFSLVPGKSEVAAEDSASFSTDMVRSSAASAAGDFDGDDADDYAYCIGEAPPPPGTCKIVTADGTAEVSGFSTNQVRVRSLGDINGDGLTDLGFTDEDSFWALYGHVLAGDVDLGALTPDMGFQLQGEGSSVLIARGVGDVNGDEVADFAVADTVSGRLVVVFGIP